MCIGLASLSLTASAQSTSDNGGSMGSVTGKVALSMGAGIAYANVSIVSAYDPGVVLYSTTSDANGSYLFTGVNSTMRADGSTEYAYMIRATAEIGEGYSAPFGVIPNTTTATCVIIFTKPDTIVVTAAKNNITADGRDNTILTAYVTDSMGNPVADGYPITFIVGNWSSDPVRLGEVISVLPPQANETTVKTTGGNASVVFGWTQNPGADYAVIAYWAENGSIYGTTDVYSVPLTQHGTGTIAGRVTYGNTDTGLGNARVTLCSPPDFDTELYVTYADANGYFQMTGINDTVNDQGYASYSYMLHAYDDRYGMGYSGCFGVWPDMTNNMDVHVYPPPANIVVTAERDTVAPDGTDNVTITAYAYDFLGNPVSSQSVRVQVLDTSGGMGWITDEYESFFDHDLTLTVMNGTARAKFGWMTVSDASNSIVVSNVDNASINGSVSITSTSSFVNTGSVAGNVTAPDGMAIGGAHIAIVSIYDPGVELYSATSDANGHYLITGVNNTRMTDFQLDNAYMVHASHPYYGEGYSLSFGVAENSTTLVDVTLYTEPRTITMTSSGSQVMANGTDYITVTANVTDANGNPITDGFLVGFELSGDGAQLGNASTGLPLGTNWTVARTVGGQASVAFGWTKSPGTNYTITAFYHDNRSISGSIVIDSVYPQDNTGIVTGRVTLATGNWSGIANVAIVSAYDPGIELYNTTTDEYGYYRFTGVNSTQNDQAYKVHAYTPYGEGYSASFGVATGSTTVTTVVVFTEPRSVSVTAQSGSILANGADHTVITAYVTDSLGNPVADGYVIIFSTPSTDVQFGDAATGLPSGANVTNTTTLGGYARAAFGWTTTPDHNYTIIAGYAGNSSVWGSAVVYSAVQHGPGMVAGRVTTATGYGIGAIRVAIVSASDGTTELYNTTADANGYYQFAGVKDTLGIDGTLNRSYMVSAYSPVYGGGYSSAFGVRPNDTTMTAVVIFTKPTGIAVAGEKSRIVANGTDHTTISAYLTDALGQPVADGYLVRFHMNRNTTGMGKFATADNSTPEGSYDMVVPTVNGTARIEFGWMTKVSKSTVITASWADNASVKGSTTINSVPK